MTARQPEMTAEQMRQYLGDVGELLLASGVTGEIVLAGGAVMVLSEQVQILLESLFE